MQLTYTITLADWKSALRLHSRQRIGRRIHYFIHDFVFPTLAIIGLAWIVYAQVTGDTKTVDDLAAVVTAFVGLATVLPIVRNYAIRKSFKGFFSPSASVPGYSLDINDERIVSTRPRVGEATYFWTGICAVAQNEKMIMLYISEILFLGIPVRVLTSDQRAELNSLPGRHVMKKEP